MGSNVGTNRVTADALTFCEGAKPIYWSNKDTVKTVAQIKPQNKLGVEICGWSKK